MCDLIWCDEDDTSLLRSSSPQKYNHSLTMRTTLENPKWGNLQVLICNICTFMLLNFMVCINVYVKFQTQKSDSLMVIDPWALTLWPWIQKYWAWLLWLNQNFFVCLLFICRMAKLIFLSFFIWGYLVFMYILVEKNN